jgi:phosphomannomutase
MRLMPSTAAEPTAEYRCPGQPYTISRAVHLGRLVSFYPPCRTCPHRDDTGQLSPRTLRRLQEAQARGPQAPLFFEEGMAGVCPNDFGPPAARAAAVALGMLLQRQRAETAEAPVVLIAGDGRPLTAEIQAAVGEGLRWAACHVVDLGAATAPCVALAIDHLQAAGGLLVGNPADRPQSAGLKFWALGPRPLSAGGLLDQLAAIAAGPVDRPSRSFGSRRRFQADEPYLASLAQQYHALRPLRILLDTQCIPMARYLGQLTAPVACEVLARAGGPSRLGEEVVARAAHFGLSVRDDGEVCRFTDERGRDVPAERILLLLAREQLRQQPGGSIVVEPETSPQTLETLAAWGAQPTVAGPRRAAIDVAMRQTAACLGGGPSGRFWFTATPSAADALRAVTQLLVLLSRSDRRFSEVLDAEAAVR